MATIKTIEIMNTGLIKLIGLTAFIAFMSCSANETEKTVPTEPDIASTKEQLPDSNAVGRIEDNKDALTSMYVKAIQDFIDAIHQKDNIVLDTLFFIKRNNGQPDDFPDIELPQNVKQTRIQLLTQQEADNNQELFRKYSPCINLIGEVNKNEAAFIFATFYPKFKHQYDVYLNYNFNSEKKNYELEKTTIEMLIYDKHGQPGHFAVYQDGKHINDKSIK